MLGVFPLTPAYGRDYRSKAEVEKAFYEGKDFVTARGPYCSRTDFIVGTQIQIRYNRLKNVHIFNKQEGK